MIVEFKTQRHGLHLAVQLGITALEVELDAEVIGDILKMEKLIIEFYKLWLMTANPCLIGLRGNMFASMSIEKRIDVQMPLPSIIAINYKAFVFIDPHRGFKNYPFV